MSKEKKLRLKSLDGCILRIGPYPYFHYNASNGGGVCTTRLNEGEKIQKLEFNKEEFTIPPLNYKNTKLLGIPLLPGLEIKMVINRLEGTLERGAGKISLDFESEFIFTIFSIIKFRNLIVKTVLTTDSVQGKMNSTSGDIIRENGIAKIVGIATIPKTRNWLLDIFLGLPSEALAILKCIIIEENSDI